jgi:hypothetical protein
LIGLTDVRRTALRDSTWPSSSEAWRQWCQAGMRSPLDADDQREVALGGGEVPHGQTIRPPWTEDHRVALAMTIVAR